MLKKCSSGHLTSTQVSTAFVRLGSGIEEGEGAADSVLCTILTTWKFCVELLKTMQVPMVPIAKPDEMGLRGYQQAQALYQQLDLYSEPEWGVPTMILWNHGGSSVSVLGSWDNWSKRYILSPVASSTFFHQLTWFTHEYLYSGCQIAFLFPEHLSMELVWARQALQRSGRDFTLIKVLPSGVYQFKFCVDGQWMYSPDLPAVSDDTDNVNNILDVQVSFHCQCLCDKATTLGLISALGIEKGKRKVHFLCCLLVPPLTTIENYQI